MFKRELFGEKLLGDDDISLLVDLTQKVFLIVERELKLTGFWENISARNRLKAEIQQILVSKDFLSIPELIKGRMHIISRIIEIAEKNNDSILYAK